MIGSKRTEEQRKKMSDSKKGKKLSINAYAPESIEKRRIKLLGRSHTPESNQKRSDSQKGKEFSESHRIHLTENIRERVRSGKHNWYRGGITSDPYPSEFGSFLKRQIRIRDNHRCRSCGVNVYCSKLGHVHHIDGNKQNCDPSNLMLLCATCHNAVHSRIGLISPYIEMLKSKLYK
jgi:hypothetical protein